jgi:type IV pilus assembly protein PilA
MHNSDRYFRVKSAGGRMRINNKGFSLIELMVVVAIIGVLASIGIPQINKYMARARQTEAKTNLASIYTANKSFYAEFNIYDNQFNVIGFRPEGKLRYNAGWGAAGTQCILANYGYTGAGGGAINALGHCGTGGVVGANGCIVLTDGNTAIPAAATALTCTTSFTAGAIGKISTGGTNDQWTINQVKVLTNTADGTQ